MRDGKERCGDILQSIEDIQTFVSGITEARFLKINETDRKTFRAVCDCVSTLGEAVKNLSSDITDKNDGIDWIGLAKMKDIITHQYFRVRLDLIWNTIARELPDLKEFVEHELSSD